MIKKLRTLMQDNLPFITCVLALTLLVGVVLENLLHDPTILPEPDQCAICDGEASSFPCLLNLTTGEVGEMRGDSVPGVFHYFGLAGTMGVWDSDARAFQVSLPKSNPPLSFWHYCRPCRETLLLRVPGKYAILDLSDPRTPGIYSVSPGASYHILDQRVSIEDGPDYYTLTASPT